MSPENLHSTSSPTALPLPVAVEPNTGKAGEAKYEHKAGMNLNLNLKGTPTRVLEP